MFGPDVQAFLNMDICTMTRFLVLLAAILFTHAHRHDVKYSNFDDYLDSLDEDQQAVITGDSQLFEGSGSEDEFSQEIQGTKFTPPLRTGLTGSKDVACCSLGQLAGDKGYHCYSRFYAARTILRNQNRAHNKKLGFHGSESVPHYGTKIMRTFEQCVASRSMVFYKCCHLAAVQRKSRPHYDNPMEAI